MLCQPDQPLPPKLIGAKKKNELTLRWTSSCENGSPITSYILECQEINAHLDNYDAILATTTTTISSSEGEKQPRERISSSDKDLAFVQVYKGALKQFTVKKLSPSTCYAFRVACENAFGVSEFSKPTLIYTSRSVPSVPEPPHLVDASINTLRLAWGPKRGNETDYELQLHDLGSPHGFLSVYNGPLLEYECDGLKTCTVYQCRLRAKNEEGNSAWADSVAFSTLADIPQSPLRLQARAQNRLG